MNVKSGPDSENQHRIAVAVEPIPPVDGVSIDGEDLVAARKRRREDQERRLRQMEVGDEAVDGAEPEAGGDEDGGVALERTDPATLVGGEENSDAAWYYPEPKPAAAEIRDRIAFWKGVEVG